MSKSKFPPKEGWITMKFTMTTKKPLSEKEIMELASFGNPDKYEFGVVEQYGARIKVVAREKKAVPA